MYRKSTCGFREKQHTQDSTGITNLIKKYPARSFSNRVLNHFSAVFCCKINETGNYSYLVKNIKYYFTF